MKKGAFLTLYGINNIGKSTHSKRLVERLQREGYDPVYLKYPIYDLDPTGPELNTILRGGHAQDVSEEDLQTLFMQNRKDFEPKLRAMLAEGKIVVAEDYTQTGISWGTAKGLDESWVEALNEELLKEDFSLLLVGERAMHMKEKGHIHESDDELVMKVDKVLRTRAKRFGWPVVQLQPTKDETAELIWVEVKNFLTEFSVEKLASQDAA